MREITVLILFLICGSSLYCQIAEIKEEGKTDIVRNTLLVKTSPLGYTNYFIRRVWALNLGVEYRFGENWAVYVEGSLPSKSLKYIRPEIRLYINESRWEGNYVSIEYSYIEQHFETGDSIGYGDAYYKDYSMSKYLNTLKIKYGWHWEVGSNFSMDAYVGLGIRDRNGIVKGLTEEEIEDREIGSAERFFFLDEGRYYVPNLAGGIRICYAFL